MLLPSILIRRLDFKRSSCKKYGVVQILQVKKYPGQVEENFSIVGRHSQRSAETLNGRLGVAFYPPEVCYLVVNFNTLWFLSFRFLKPSFYGVDVNLGPLLGLFLEEICHLRLRDVEMRGSVLNAHEMIVVGEVDWLPAVQNFIVQVIINNESSVVPGRRGIAGLAMTDPVETAVVLVGGFPPHPLRVGHRAQQYIHHHLLLPNILLHPGLDDVDVAQAGVGGGGGGEADIGHNLALAREIHQAPGVGGLALRVAVESAAEEEQETASKAGPDDHGWRLRSTLSVSFQ